MTLEDAPRGGMAGEQLVAARHKLGLSQAQLAAQLEVPVNTLARWERGEVTIRHPRILALALRALAHSFRGSTLKPNAETQLPEVSHACNEAGRSGK